MGLFRALFGGSKQKSTSSNLAYPYLKESLGGVVPYAGQGASAVSALLSGDPTGFNKYKDATGYDFMSESGSRGITANAAARGLLRSGSTSSALVELGNKLQQLYAGSYLDKLLALAQLGLGAGNVIGGAGQQSISKGSSTPGIAGFIGSLFSGGASGG